MAEALPTAGLGRRSLGHPTAGGVSSEGKCDGGWRLRPRPWLYSAELGTRSEAVESAPACKRHFAEEPGTRVTAVGRAGQGTRDHRSSRKPLGSARLRRASRPFLALLLPRTPLSHPLATWVKLTTATAAGRPVLSPLRAPRQG
ncbi:Pyridoxal-Dependent Decarboxylase Domain-Containing Protein 1 [Manis pentadactyla]|nr:Pyridoxal-Dependent Decarboxylase Domain-Containing Protein 1 [Manis pentadactyla]